MKTYPLKVLTPEKRIFGDDVISVTVTCEDGQLSVLAGHAPMVAMLVEGPIVIRTTKETRSGVGERGVLQVARGEAIVMIHAFAWSDDEMAAELNIENAAASDMAL